MGVYEIGADLGLVMAVGNQGVRRYAELGTDILDRKNLRRLRNLDI